VKRYEPVVIEGKQLKRDGFSGDRFNKAIRESLADAGVREIRVNQKTQDAVYGTGRRPADCPGAGLVWREVKNLDNMRKD